MILDFFPQGIATGKAFLGREDAVQALQNNISNGHHTLLMAPRRWGKTSLARNTLAGMDILSNDVNFFLCRSALSVERKIRHCITEALSQSGSQQQTLFDSMRRFFAQSKKTWSFGFRGVIGVEITPDNETHIAENIYTSLSLLESTMQALNKKTVLFFDEVQEIDLLNEGREIQGAIREFAQEAKHVVFIFSGSNRRLLHHMFDHQAMPLYELCERILLKKINATTYEKYIAKASTKISGTPASEAVLKEILTLSMRHPKRIYNLCYQIWQSQPKKVTVESVQHAWQYLVETRQKDIRSKLSPLNNSQLMLLTLIATDFALPISGKEAQKALNLSSGAIVKALQFLEDEDFVTRDAISKQYSLIDPLVKSVLCQYERYNVGL